MQPSEIDEGTPTFISVRTFSIKSDVLFRGTNIQTSQYSNATIAILINELA